MQKFQDALAFGKGEQSFKTNQPFSSNPYSSETEEHGSWNRGWKRAMYNDQINPGPDGYLTQSYND